MIRPYVILGDGALGTSAAEHLRRMDPAAPIQILSDDHDASYFRAALTNYLIGELRAEQLFSVTPDWYSRYAIQRIRARATRIDPTKRTVHTEDGRSFDYAALVIGTGARARTASVPGSQLPGVTALRTFHDAQQILDKIRRKRIRRAAIVGGGPLGLEWVHGLREHGVEVELVLRRRHLLANILDRRRSDIVLARLQRAGVHIQEGEISEIRAGASNEVGSVALSNGATVPVDMVGYAIGNQPNIEFLGGSGIDVERRGIVVNAHLETSVSGIYAGGDVAVVHGENLGLWEPARKHGKRIARNLMGDVAPYNPGVHYMATRLFDLDFAYAQISDAPTDPEIENREAPAGSPFSSQQLRLHNGKLVGLTLMGERGTGVRRRGRLLRRMMEADCNIAPVRDRLMDPAFDLKSWAMPHLGGAQRARSAGPVGARTAVLRRSRVVNVREAARQARGAAQQNATLLIDGQVIAVLDGPATLGRVQDNTVQIDNDSVSRNHVRIVPERGRWWLENLSETNPASIVGEPVANKMPLSDGAQFLLGEVVVRFRQGRIKPVVEVREHAPMATMAGIPKAVRASVRIDGAKPLNLTGLKESFTIDKASAVLGQSDEADIQLRGQGVALEHLQFVRMGDTWYARGLGRDDIRINGKLLDCPTALEDGDKLTIGTVDLNVGQTRPMIPVAKEERPKGTMDIEIQRVLVALISETSGKKSRKVLDGEVRIGRNPDWATLLLEDDTVSSKHCSIGPIHDGALLHDHGSTNGSFVDGERVGADPVHIRPGSDIKLGEVTLTLAWEQK